MYSVCINAQTRLDYLRSMEIFIADIPDEGLIREGELPVSIFDLAEDDYIHLRGLNEHVVIHGIVISFEFPLLIWLNLKFVVCLFFHFDHSPHHPLQVTL